MRLGLPTPIFPVSKDYLSEKEVPLICLTPSHVLCGRIPEEKLLEERGASRRGITMWVELSVDFAYTCW